MTSDQVRPYGPFFWLHPADPFASSLREKLRSEQKGAVSVARGETDEQIEELRRDRRRAFRADNSRKAKKGKKRIQDLRDL
jgi:hypothetical protein